MEFTDSGRRLWLAYVEAAPPVRRGRFLSETLLPGRRVRFDSVDESRATSRVPAGSPFLPEPRLQVILAESAALPAAPAVESAPANAWQDQWALVQAAVLAMARFCNVAATSARGGLQRAITGYRTLVSRSAMLHHR